MQEVPEEDALDAEQSSASLQSQGSNAAGQQQSMSPSPPLVPQASVPDKPMADEALLRSLATSIKFPPISLGAARVRSREGESPGGRGPAALFDLSSRPFFARLTQAGGG